MRRLLLLFVITAAANHFAFGQMTFGMKIGQTFYDQQEPYSAGKRIAKKSNGAISVVWSESCIPEPVICPTCPFATAGPGYNHFNASGWVHGTDGTCDEPGATHGIFSERAISPELLVFPSGRELVIAHGTTGIISSSRSQAGVGGMAGWSASQPISAAGAVGNAWPQVATSGNYLHLIATCDSCTTASGVTSPVRYYRSSDEGMSWNITDLELPGMDSTTFTRIGAGNYAISAYQNFVAIVAGIAAPGNQWAMWKSTDNGTTWSKTVLRSFALADTVTATSNPNALPHLGSLIAQYALYEGNDMHHSILVDQTGGVHAWSGYMLSGIDRANPANSVPKHMLSEGIWYWTESMSAPAILVNQREDVYPPGDPRNHLAWGTYLGSFIADSPYGYTGLLSMPASAIAPNGDIYIVYSGVVEGTTNTGDSTGQGFRDLYLMRRAASGTWTPPVNLVLATTGTRTDFVEEIFPSVIPTIGADNYLYLTFQTDLEPGMRLAHDYDPGSMSEIMFGVINVIPPISVVNPPILASPEEQASLAGIKAIPNPSGGVANLHLSFTSETAVSVRVLTVLGQEIVNLPVRNISAGDNVLPIDLSAQPSGVYLCTVLVNGVPQTLRLLKE